MFTFGFLDIKYVSTRMRVCRFWYPENELDGVGYNNSPQPGKRTVCLFREGACTVLCTMFHMKLLVHINPCFYTVQLLQFVKIVQVNDTVHLVCKTHVKYSSVSSKEYYFITNITKECHTSVYILAEPLMASRILHVVIRKLCLGN